MRIEQAQVVKAPRERVYRHGLTTRLGRHSPTSSHGPRSRSVPEIPYLSKRKSRSWDARWAGRSVM